VALALSFSMASAVWAACDAFDNIEDIEFIEDIEISLQFPFSLLGSGLITRR
jgi:hypothetical protein